MTGIELLRKENERLIAENTYLKKLLDNNGISYEYTPKQPELVDTTSEIKRRIKLFMKPFCARTEFYAERWENKEGRSGYAPACGNRWTFVCPKKKDKSVKCYECDNKAWIPFTEDVAYKHLVGKDERSRAFVAGTYTLLSDSTCKFLVFDFDNHDGSRMIWKDEAKLLRDICKRYGIDTALERSRSGNGAHIWIFFEEPIPAKLARKFGAALLAKGAEIIHQKDFNTFDRMMPNQDEMPIGGMGNLIALPLQGIPRKSGNSVFVDDDWNVIPNQWEYLEQKKLLSKEFVMNKLSEWKMQNEPFVLELEDDESKDKPWEKKKLLTFEKEDILKPLTLTLADCIYIPKNTVKPRTMNRIRKMATFSNPQFYKMQAMQYSTKQIPRYIQCFRDFDKFVALPRGCLPTVEEKLQEAGISYKVEDCRNCGRVVNVSFQGSLQPEQEKATITMLEHEIGILGAATGFGKTVLGTYLIAARKVNALILVHNREIMKQWQESIEKFLQINKEIPIMLMFI